MVGRKDVLGTFKKAPTLLPGLSFTSSPPFVGFEAYAVVYGNQYVAPSSFLNI